MDSSTIPPLRFSVPPCAPASARTVFKLLQQLRHGTLTLHLPDGSVQRFGQPHAEGDAHTTMVLKNWNVCGAVLKSGDIGLAESFIAGDWTSPHLVDLLQLFVRNRRELEDVVYGSWAGRLLYRVRHLLNRNSRSTARKNIHAHYDLGNAFYSLWLDDTMNYSSAWFEGQTDKPLPDAQYAKVRRALQMAGVQRGDRVLEIGCGWGALVDMAVNEFSASVTGVTLSTEQLAFARQRMHSPNGIPTVPPHTDLRLQDYRDVQGPFDRVSSVGMFEHVGLKNLASYFRIIHDLLAPGGWALNHGITSTDPQNGATSYGGGDFIDRYVFPNGELAHIGTVLTTLQEGGLEAVDIENLRRHYARTLQCWSDAFEAKTERLKQLVDEKTWRIWRVYLVGCQWAFEHDEIALYQILCRRAGQAPDGLPWSRRWVYGAA